MTYLPEDGLPLLGDIGVRFGYGRIPLAVFLYHIKCYIVRYYVGIYAKFFSLWRFQPFLFCRISLASFSLGRIG